LPAGDKVQPENHLKADSRFHPFKRYARRIASAGGFQVPAAIVLIIFLASCQSPSIRILDGQVKVGSFTGFPLQFCEGAGYRIRLSQGDNSVDGEAEVRNKSIYFLSSDIGELNADSAMTIYLRMKVQPVSKECPMVVGQSMKAVDVTLVKPEGEDESYEIPLYVFKELVWGVDPDQKWDE